MNMLFDCMIPVYIYLGHECDVLELTIVEMNMGPLNDECDFDRFVDNALKIASTKFNMCSLQRLFRQSGNKCQIEVRRKVPK